MHDRQNKFGNTELRWSMGTRRLRLDDIIIVSQEMSMTLNLLDTTMLIVLIKRTNDV